MDSKAQSEIPVGAGVSGTDVEGGTRLPSADRGEVRVSKHMTVLDHNDVDEQDMYVRFYNLNEDSGGIETEIVMKTDLWNEMGRTDTITVSVEPGDRLNV